MKYIYWLREVDSEDLPLVGTKGAQLGELTRAHFPLLPGFILSSYAYSQFLRENHLFTKITHLLESINYEVFESVLQVSKHIQKLILDETFSEKLAHDIFSSYRLLGGTLHDTPVTLRPSLTADEKNTSDHIFGESLQVIGEANLLLSIKQLFASIFDPKAITHRHEHHIDHFRIGIAIIIQKRIGAEKSGTLLTLDPITNDTSKIIIEAYLGLSPVNNEKHIVPDHYEVDKKSLILLKKRPVVQTVILQQTGTGVKEVLLTPKEGRLPKLTDSQITQLASLGKSLEKQYFFPQMIQWEIENDTLYLIDMQTLEKTILTSSEPPKQSSEHPLLLGNGLPGSSGIATGPVKVVLHPREIGKVEPGDIIVTHQTTHDFSPALKKAAGVITESGGKLSHAAILARQFGIPAVVGMESATSFLRNGTTITMNGTKGQVFGKGHLLHALKPRLPKKENTTTATKVYTTISTPQELESLPPIESDGLGILPGGILIQELSFHPKSILKEGKKDQYVKDLADKIEKICIAYSPRPVVYQLSNLTSDEYRKLSGGSEYESLEENAILGFRGAFRLLSQPEILSLELEALRLLRTKKNIKNISLMMPFVRTVKECVALKHLISQAGLFRGPSFRLFLSIDTPSTVFYLEKFIHVGIDGVSLNIENLATLLLGVDLHNREISHHYNEFDETILWAIRQVVKEAQKYHLTTSATGPALSLYPELLEQLVGFGITSISVPPVVTAEVKKQIAMVEKKLIS